MRWLGVLAALVTLTGLSGAAALKPFWNDAELGQIKAMSLESLLPLKPDHSNRFSDDPNAAALGKALFFDTRFSANGAVSCASCHMQDRQFQDDLPVGHGMADGTRRTMPIAGTAYHPFLFWDGRKDSQWSQALGPVENPVEHGSDRAMVVGLIAANYRAEYETVFGALPDLDGLPAHAAPEGTSEAASAWQALTVDQQRNINRVFANFGKAIAAFERTIGPPSTRFDAFAAALAARHETLANQIFTDQERNGLKLFLGPGRCINCHASVQFEDQKFHNIGLPGATEATDSGRSTSVLVVDQDPFNCAGEFSDADPKKCLWLKFLQIGDPLLVGAFKSPSLRGVAQRPPYMHNGQFANLHDVLAHYNKAPKADFGKTELVALQLTEQQLADIEAFLKTLNVGDADVSVKAQ